MSKSILVMGESGSGKTTAMRNLPPDRTYYLDVDGKGLSWRGWRKAWNADAKNYRRTTSGEEILAAMQAVDKAKDEDGKPRYDYIVIDTINSSLLASEMDRVGESGYGKWTDIASDGYGICRVANLLRDDLTIIVIGHAETISDDNGIVRTRLKTNGRKLEKIVLESLFTSVLLADQVDGRYVLRTRHERSTCKTPMGAFEQDMVDNDMMEVLKTLEEYENGED